MHILLASSSPRRRQLLAEYGYDFSVEPADVKEIAPPYLTVGETTLFNAKQKALTVARRNPDAVVLGVDTLVALDGACLGKPRDLAEAFAMLSRLNGRTHEVYTGVWAVCLAARISQALVEVSQVKFRMLEEAGIRRYMDRIEPLDKAGAYAAQDDGAEGIIECITGSKTNVIGLPMEALEAMLSKWKAKRAR